jgi:hypothetical protein
VYGSELISIRFAPTGLPGCVRVGEEELEHPASARIQRTEKKNAVALHLHVQLVRIARKAISSQRLIICGRAFNVNRNFLRVRSALVRHGQSVIRRICHVANEHYCHVIRVN